MASHSRRTEATAQGRRELQDRAVLHADAHLERMDAGGSAPGDRSLPSDGPSYAGRSRRMERQHREAART